MNKSALAAPSKPQLLGFLLMLVFLAVGLGYGYYHKQRYLAVTRAQNELAAIANLKVSQIVNWRQERQSQGNAIAGNPLIVNQIRQFLAEPSAPQSRQDLERWLTALRSEYGFRSVSVYDAAGKCHLTVPPDLPFSNIHKEEIFSRALRSKSAIISDLHRGQVDRGTHLSIWIPIGKKPELEAPADGILNLQIEPGRFLYPLLQTWPTASSTAETLLLRREGEEVLYLNDLMYRTNAAMLLRLPISRPNYPAGQAVMGREGVMEGVDYRGVSVLAAMRQIPNTGWALEAKVDQEEILAPIRAYAWIAVFIVALVVLAAVMGALAFWRKRELLEMRQRMALDHQIEAILRTSGIGLGIIDEQHNLRFVDPARREKLGPVGNRKCHEYFLGCSLQCLDCGVMRAKETGKTVVADRYFAQNGQYLQVTTIPFHGPEGEQLFYEVALDITARKSAEEKLRESNALISLFIKQSPIFAYVKEVTASESRVMLASDNYLEMIGISSADMVGKTMTDLFPAEFATKITEDDQAVIAKGEVSKVEENFNGRHYRSIKFPIRLKGKTLLAGYTIDITERKRAEEKLRESERRFRSYFEVPLIGIAITTPEKGWLEINDCLCDLLAYSRAELVARTWAELTHPEDLAADVSQFNRVLDGEIDGYCLDKRFLRKDGQILWASVAVRCVRRADGAAGYFIATLQDITARKQAEAEREKLQQHLMQAQKLESIGRLAGGVAHDFNNILAAMMMNISFMEQNPKLDPETQELLKELLAEAERAASLTRQLLMFSRKSVMERKVLDLNEVVANLLKMLARLIGEHVSLQFERASGLPLVEADQGMIEQVLMNLAVNARDAMPGGGRLSIRLSVVPIGAERIKDKVDVLPGSFVCLAAQDTGCGMDEATLNNIFEPFFTTKEVGKGTGLGLATVYGIAALHKGWVEVESEVGQGATFRVYLPQRNQGISEPDQTVKRELFRGRETILLVEDDDAVRRMSARGLTGLGYQVLEAENGLAGMKLWQAHPGQIDLLLTDMVMPEGLTGLALAEKLKVEKPSLKVILCSGYNEEMSGQTTAELKGIQYLQKPYSVALLSKKIRECLDGA